MLKPPITPDDIDALSKAWNEGKAATDALLAKFREGASKDEIDDAIRAAEQMPQCFGLAPLLDARVNFSISCGRFHRLGRSRRRSQLHREWLAC